MNQGAVARHLNDRGFRMQIKITQRRRDGSLTEPGTQRLFETGDIRRILDQRSYLGFFGWGESQLSKWVHAEGPAETHHDHLRIVDVALWQRARSVTRERAGGPRRNACATSALAGLLRCPRCGGLLVSRRVRWQRPGGAEQRFMQYTCLANRKRGRAACAGWNVGEGPARRAIEALLVEHLEALQLRRFLDRAAEQQAKLTDAETTERLRAELQQTVDRLDRVVRAVADGTFTPAEARNVKLDLLEKRERLEARLTKLEAKARLQGDLLEAVAYVQDNLPVLISELDDARFRRLCALVFEHLVVTVEGRGSTWNGAITSYELTGQYRELVSTFGAHAPT